MLRGLDSRISCAALSDLTFRDRVQPHATLPYLSTRQIRVLSIDWLDGCTRLSSLEKPSPTSGKKKKETDEREHATLECNRSLFVLRLR